MATIRTARSGDTHTVSYADGKRTHRYNQTVIVELDSGDPDPITGVEVRNMAGVPKPGLSLYSPRAGRVLPFCICKSVTPTPDPKSRRLWRVKCTFELFGDEEEDKDETEDPLNLNPKIEPFCESGEAIMLKDWDDKIIKDPFGDLFDDPVMAPIPLAGVRVKRYVAGYDETTLAYWTHVTNDAPWRNQPIDAWHCRKVTGQEVQYGPTTIGQLTFDIVSNPLEMELPKADGSPGTEVRRYGWLDVRALRSYKHIVDDNGTAIERINRVKRDGPPKQVWVDKDGNKVDDPYFFDFRKMRQRDFEQIVVTP